MEEDGNDILKVNLSTGTYEIAGNDFTKDETVRIEDLDEKVEDLKDFYNKHLEDKTTSFLTDEEAENLQEYLEDVLDLMSEIDTITVGELTIDSQGIKNLLEATTNLSKLFRYT